MKKDYVSGIYADLCLLSLLFYLVFTPGCSPERTLEVHFDSQAVAGFPVYITEANLPSGRVFTVSGLDDEEGTFAQKLDDTTLVFILDKDAEPGETRTYQIRSAGNNYSVYIQVDSGSGSIQFSTPQQEILRYHTEERLPQGLPEYYRRSGFIHPVYTPGGLVLTDDFPVGHSHQHGIFTAWVNTTFRGEDIDFWNQQAMTGTVRLDSVILVESGPVFGRLKTLHSYVSLEFGDVLSECWDLTVFSIGETFLLDLSIHQVNTQEDTLYLNDYIYGGLAFRGNAAWNREDTLNFQSEVQFLTAEGRGREDGNHTRPGWVAAFGDLKGELGGIAIIDHKANEYYPQPVRIHPEMPYFCMAPIVNHPFHIPPDGEYRAKYRMISYDGQAPKALIDRAAISMNY